MRRFEEQAICWGSGYLIWLSTQICRWTSFLNYFFFGLICPEQNLEDWMSNLITKLSVLLVLTILYFSIFIFLFSTADLLKIYFLCQILSSNILVNLFMFLDENFWDMELSLSIHARLRNCLTFRLRNLELLDFTFIPSSKYTAWEIF